MIRITYLFIVSVAFCWASAPSDGNAKKRGKSKSGSASVENVRSSLRLELIDRSLLDLPFGGDLESVMKWVGKRLEVVHGPRLKAALDSRERDRIRVSIRDELSEIERSAVSFTGRRTGFEGSIVAGEFEDGVGDSLLLFREGSIQHYLFLHQGKLYKYARPGSGGKSFHEVSGQYEREHGVPHASRQRPTEVVWRGLTFDLTLKDKRLLFAADLLTLNVIELAELRDAALAKRNSTSGKGKTGALEDFIDRGDEGADE